MKFEPSDLLIKLAYQIQEIFLPEVPRWSRDDVVDELVNLHKRLLGPPRPTPRAITQNWDVYVNVRHLFFGTFGPPSANMFLAIPKYCAMSAALRAQYLSELFAHIEKNGPIEVPEKNQRIIVGKHPLLYFRDSEKQEKHAKDMESSESEEELFYESIDKSKLEPRFLPSGELFCKYYGDKALAWRQRSISDREESIQSVPWRFAIIPTMQMLKGHIPKSTESEPYMIGFQRHFITASETGFRFIEDAECGQQEFEYELFEELATYLEEHKRMKVLGGWITMKCRNLYFAFDQENFKS